MNAYERVFGRLAGKPVDKLPNLNIVMMFAAAQIGTPYGKYVTDYKELCKGVIHCYENFGIDCLCTISDPMREAEGLGSIVTIPENDVPYAKNPLITDPTCLNGLHAIAPENGKRMNDRLEAVRYLKDYSKGEVPVIGWVEGSVAECCDLMGVSEFMYNLYDYPDEMYKLLDICYEQSRLFALAQIAAGADIIGVGDAASSLLSPTLFADFATPYQQKLTAAIHAAGAKVKLHICGNIQPMLQHIATVKADIVDIDHMVDFQLAADTLKGISSVNGNFDPVSVILQGTPESIRMSTKKCMSIQSNTHMISAGCEIPRATKVENLSAVMEELRH